MNASLYIHIPFCVSHCDYCDFYSELAPKAGTERSSLFDHFVETLKRELDFVFSYYDIRSVPTLYIGGGTPSVLGRKWLETILVHLSALIPQWPGEVTVEANPESIDEALLSMLRDRGVNRLSLGIQSLQSEARRAVNRSGTVDQCRAALKLAAQYFSGAFSVDLMSGLPFQTREGLCADIDRVVSAGANHISLYTLTLEDETALAVRVRSGQVKLPSEEEAEDLWLSGREALYERGLPLYEVSNFARPGNESRHNMRYWRMESWVGCGPGASSTVIRETAGTAMRYKNTANLASYLAWNAQGLPPGEEEPLDRETLLRESLMMGFRTLRGPDEALFRSRFHQSIESLIPETLTAWRNRGLMEEERPALTPEGLLLLNGFIVDCFRELER